MNEKFKGQVDSLEKQLVRFEQFKQSDPVIAKTYDILRNFLQNIDRQNVANLIKDGGTLVGYYAYLEPIANEKNGEANIAYIAKKRYQAGTYLRIKEGMKITNETARSMTDEETADVAAYETAKRLEADNYASLCDSIKMAVSFIQTILATKRQENFHTNLENQ